MHRSIHMGMLVVVGMLIGLGLVFWLLVSAVNDDGRKRHGWLAVVPLLIIVGWLVEQLIMG